VWLAGWLLQVFNDSNTFSEWFTRFLGVDTFGEQGAAGGAASDAAALDREKKILVVNRLHQILSPFMLRRMVSCAAWLAVLGLHVLQPVICTSASATFVQVVLERFREVELHVGRSPS
jgi:hypothetical protein